MGQYHLLVKEGKPIFGYGVRNPATYGEGQYRVFLFNTRLRRDKEAESAERYMPEVKCFDIDIAKVVGLT